MTVPPQPEDADTADLYADFQATADRLIAHYSHLADSATTDQDHDAWWRRTTQVRDDKRSVPTRDRAQISAHTTRWAAELARLQTSSTSTSTG
ncbi:hypothetical protein [Streptacidiphilus sp. PAMC 29251]